MKRILLSLFTLVLLHFEIGLAQSTDFPNILDGSPFSATRYVSGDGTSAAPAYSFSSDAGAGWYKAGTNQLALMAGTSGGFAFGVATEGGVAVPSTGVIGFLPAANILTQADTKLFRDAAGIIAQKNSTNAQEFRVYRSTTGPAYVSLRAAAPTIGACGASPSVAGADSAMILTVGTGGAATACVGNFSATFANAPICTANSSTTADAALAVTTSTSAVTVTKASALTASSTINVICFGR